MNKQRRKIWLLILLAGLMPSFPNTEENGCQKEGTSSNGDKKLYLMLGHTEQSGSPGAEVGRIHGEEPVHL